MSDDQKITQRYRELAREEPPRHLDEAILAASRRAAETRPAPLLGPSGRRRWYFPLAAAAVIVLAVAVTVHVERERPELEVAEAPIAAPPAPSSTREEQAAAPAQVPSQDLRAKRDAEPLADLQKAQKPATPPPPPPDAVSGARESAREAFQRNAAGAGTGPTSEAGGANAGRSPRACVSRARCGASRGGDCPRGVRQGVAGAVAARHRRSEAAGPARGGRAGARGIPQALSELPDPRGDQREIREALAFQRDWKWGAATLKKRGLSLFSGAGSSKGTAARARSAGCRRSLPSWHLRRCGRYP